MKILVVDDEPLARERLLRLLAKLQPQAQVFEASDGHEAITRVEKHAPELVLLDISMPGMDGIEVAGVLDGMQCPPAVVFCTAHDEFALQALQQHAAAYLMKPIRETELQKTLESAGRVNRMQLEALQGPGELGASVRQTISSHSHRGFETMSVGDIRCFIARDKYVTAITPELELLIPDTLRDLEKEFGELFIRIHRNALVATAYIERLEKSKDSDWKAILRGIEYSPIISRRHLSDVKKHLREG